MAENLAQIGTWAKNGISREQENIRLYLRLIQKDIAALESFPEVREFSTNFTNHCKHFEKLLEEYNKGLKDHGTWAKGVLALSENIVESAKLIV